MRLSDDENNERLRRFRADVEVSFSLACAGLMAACDRAAAVLSESGEVMTAALDAGVATMTAAQRETFNALAACGTPPLDAACEAEEMHPR